MGKPLVNGNFPDEIGAGLTFDVLLTLTPYPAPEWAVTVHMRGPSSIDLPATAEGNQHRIHVDAAQTATWPAGTYWYSMRATRGSEIVEVEADDVVVLPDLLSAPPGYDGRTDAQKALDAIEAVIANRATMDQERYRINNRELYRTPIKDLLMLRDRYREEVRREKDAASGKNSFGSVVRVRLQ